MIRKEKDFVSIMLSKQTIIPRAFNSVIFNYPFYTFLPTKKNCVKERNSYDFGSTIITIILYVEESRLREVKMVL